MAGSDPTKDKTDRPDLAIQGTDHTLLRRFQDGQQDAATALYVRYAKRLQALARRQTSQNLATRFDPEDVVQSVFRTFFRRAAEGCYEVPVGEELWQLFLVLALNKIRKLASYHRADKRDAGRTIAAENSYEIPAGISGEDASAYETMKMVVDELMSQLPPTQDKIIQLRIEGYEVNEIAELTQRSKRTVERILQQFRLKLASTINEED
jgi:RNA polymerase sigma-70 factor, ECF subfamily